MSKARIPIIISIIALVMIAVSIIISVSGDIANGEQTSEVQTEQTTELTSENVVTSTEITSETVAETTAETAIENNDMTVLENIEKYFADAENNCSLISSNSYEDENGSKCLEISAEVTFGDAGTNTLSYVISSTDGNITVSAPVCQQGFAGASLKEQLAQYGLLKLAEASEITLCGQSIASEQTGFENSCYIDNMTYGINGYGCSFETTYDTENETAQTFYKISK